METRDLIVGGVSFVVGFGAGYGTAYWVHAPSEAQAKILKLADEAAAKENAEKNKKAA